MKMHMKARRFVIPVSAVIVAAALAAIGGWLALDYVAHAQTSLPAPANVQVVNGDQPGQVVVSWDPVDGASGYAIRWVNNDLAWEVHRAGQDWRKLIQSLEVAGGETATRTLTIKSGAAGEVQYAFAVGSKSGPAAKPGSWSAWRFLDVPGAGGVPGGDVEVLSAALSIIRHATALDAVGSVATHAGMTRDSLGKSAQEIAKRRAALNQQLVILADYGHADRVGRIRTLANRLVFNVVQIQTGRAALGQALRSENASRVQLGANSARLSPAADASQDNQFYRLVTNVGDGSAGSENLSKGDILAHTHTYSLSSNVVLGHTLLLVASLMQEPTYVARIRETYDSVAGRLGRDVEYLRENPVPELGPGILDLAEDVRDARVGDDQDDYFVRLEKRLVLTVAERALIEANAKTLDQLLCEVDALAVVAQGKQPTETCPADDAAPGVPGVTANQIEFGQSAAFTGPSAELGLGMRLGIEAAFREANQAGGVNGRMLALTPRDDGYEPDRAFANTRRLIENEQVFALIGAVGTPTSRAASPVAHAAGVPFIAPFTGAQLLREPQLTNVLNLRASYHQETEKMVDYLARAGKTKVAVLYQNDSYGIDGLNGVRQAVDKREGIDLVASWLYRRNTQAVKSAVYRIAEAEPEAVIMVGTHHPSAAAVKMLRAELEPDPVFMSVSFVGSNALADALGDAGAGVHVTQVVPLPAGDSIPVLADYRAALAAYNSQAEPGFVSLEGYLAGRLAIAGLELCGPAVSRECFLDAVQNAGTIDLNGFKLTFGPRDNQGSDAVFQTVLGADGQYDPVD